ncbi:MAG: phosphate transport system substrate-binding protein [Verrucomicrobiales bacterium]|jgi:phosphate transport system substrate-binding protein
MKTNLILAGMLALAGTSAMAERDQIRIVGSSTVYPFSSYTAEEFGTLTEFKSPVVESTGSGGGHKLFMTGVGDEHPDITNSSRRMKASELENNIENGVEVIEVLIGYDGIAIAQNKSNSALDLTLEQITLAVAEKVPGKEGALIANPYTHWNQIDPSLPNREIKVLGPPSSSGTRDAFHELVLHAGAESLGYPDAADGKGDGKVHFQSIRQDGVWVDSGEDDNLIVQKLGQNEDLIGIFGYSFLQENSDKLSAATIKGVAPSPKTVAAGEYPVSRSLYFYVKKNHIGIIPGLEDFVDLFLDEELIGPDGLLEVRGLVPLSDKARAATLKNWNERVVLKSGDIEE